MGNCCFVCGANPSSKLFNDEHVIPRWLLKRCGLFDQKITLPNDQNLKYGGYEVPCCVECNGLLGRELEIPVSQLLAGTHDEVFARLDGEAISKLFVWLNLIFLKTHLKDRLLHTHLDRRLGGAMIADEYYWEEIHHIHAVARSPFTLATINHDAMGSMLFFVVEDDLSPDTFDWIDFSNEQTVAVRVGRVGIIAVLTDCCAALNARKDLILKIKGSLTGTQFRELTAYMAVANTDLINRPSFGTFVAREPSEGVVLWAQHDDVPKFEPFKREVFGQALAHVLRDRLEHLDLDGVRGSEAVKERLLQGDVTFLFDADGKFRS
tara:strand:- start:950 stop:1915 length:966 start_codon:yes stop_codon:yes gene_type:complete